MAASKKKDQKPKSDPKPKGKEEEKKEEEVPQIELSFDANQRNMLQGFSEDLYGNNWFVLTSNDGEGLTRTESKSICGILTEVPTLSFSTTVANGPQAVVTDLIQGLLLNREGIAGAAGAAVGANISPQLGGGYTKTMVAGKGFQEDGFDLEFIAWKNPKEIFDPMCAPSNQQEVLEYLADFATVETNNSVSGLLDQAVDQAMAGLGSVVPILMEAADGATKAVHGGSTNDKEADTDTGFLDKIEEFATKATSFADTMLVRRWSDKQRITFGRTKFNESLHRLDILRAGILDTYLIVAIESWSCELMQDSLGQKMKVSIKCKPDQRMERKRLHLFNVEEIEGEDKLALNNGN